MHSQLNVHAWRSLLFEPGDLWCACLSFTNLLKLDPWCLSYADEARSMPQQRGACTNGSNSSSSSGNHSVASSSVRGAHCSGGGGGDAGSAESLTVLRAQSAMAQKPGPALPRCCIVRAAGVGVSGAGCSGRPRGPDLVTHHICIGNKVGSLYCLICPCCQICLCR